ncbi:hypothetical protein HBI56_008890 [Parastagonospora nodorum]|uniref:Uncharacterized protein n=1 Tax=Phaeosphaeria nodorum (strain SN15 / ATCC MYA-4574 / FGSC 10173) TaxID=321614 RepID=Q0V6B8_PHANO|nr:hypothetical protein SNOG_00446 [Parastagonospora nodorum SN15]KAH3904303.1 hypothetical protein HBH56_236350 [Parastagonospora nodorum]EAT91941.1 hypothetical protein SNOG_00446 [Parastagonospora nodorum SN15]KAH3934799.1 hypothetical protein HBH54_046380 [Parastagonospora nodorum]KAH3987093.1 hypothetical protein HBH51_010630 [Parastagonospora nodorum]KAH3987724.1 hypothetical protein HBH52_036780 [Parastagonospora nodorum]
MSHPPITLLPIAGRPKNQSMPTPTFFFNPAPHSISKPKYKTIPTDRSNPTFNLLPPHHSGQNERVHAHAEPAGALAYVAEGYYAD